MPHTPGPWREYQDGVHPVIPPHANPNDCFAICTGVHGPDAPFNKRLIIAAPDLLSALDHILDRFQKVLKGAPVRDADECIVAAQSALRNATQQSA